MSGAVVSGLARLLGDGKRPCKVISFPGTTSPVALFNLFDHETRVARVAAVKYLVEGLKLSELHLAHFPEMGDEEVKIQELFLALRDPAAPEVPFAKSPEEIRQSLTPDQREALFREYLVFADERSPIKRLNSRGEVDALLEELGKASGAKTSLACYDSISLEWMVRYAATRLAMQTTPTPSDSSLASVLQASSGDPPGASGSSPGSADGA